MSMGSPVGVELPICISAHEPVVQDPGLTII